MCIFQTKKSCTENITSTVKQRSVFVSIEKNRNVFDCMFICNVLVSSCVSSCVSTRSWLCRVIAATWTSCWSPTSSTIMISHFLSLLQPWVREQFVTSLWPSDAIWQHTSGSTLAQVMAWYLTAPSHYLNQCWLIMIEVMWHLPENKLLFYARIVKITHFRLLPHLPGASELKHWNLIDKVQFNFKMFIANNYSVNKCRWKMSTLTFSYKIETTS